MNNTRSQKITRNKAALPVIAVVVLLLSLAFLWIGDRKQRDGKRYLDARTDSSKGCGL